MPAVSALRSLVANGQGLSEAELYEHPEVRAALAEKLAAHQAQATGSATRVKKLMIIAEPLRFEKGEVTDKGSINQRAVIRNHNDLVRALYAGDPRVIKAPKRS